MNMLFQRLRKYPKMNHKHDFTNKGWFRGKKSHSNSNLLFELLPNFSYLRAFGQNTFQQTVKYLGGYNRTMDKFSGYILSWDKKHCCDRCGRALKYTGSKSIRLAYGVTKFKRLKECGLCDLCDALLEKDSKDKNRTAPSKYIQFNQKTPRDYRDRYIWL